MGGGCGMMLGDGGWVGGGWGAMLGDSGWVKDVV